MTAYVTLGFVVAALGVVGLPIIGSARPSIVHLFRAFKEGGLGMFPLVILHLFGPVLIAVLGAALVRGRRVQSGVLGAVALAPVAIGLLAAGYANRQIAQVLPNVEPELAARIAAQGTSELTNLVVYGHLVAAACAAVAMVVLCGAVASIDIERIAPQRTGFARRGPMAVIAVGIVWFVAYAICIVAAGREREVSLLAFVPPLWIVFATVFAALAARTTGGLRAWHDDDDARRHVSMLLIAGVLAVAAACLLERAIVGRVEMLVLGAIAGESVDGSQRVRILAELVPSWTFADRAVAIHAVFGTATFAFAFAPALGRGSRGRAIHPFVPGAAAALGALVVLGLGALFFFTQRTKLLDVVADAQGGLVPADIKLPTVETAMSSSSGSGKRVLLHADGHLKVVYAPGQEPWNTSLSNNYLVVADEAAPAGFLLQIAFDAVPVSDVPGAPLLGIPTRSTTRVQLPVRTPHRATEVSPSTTARLGPYAVLARNDVSFVEVIVPAEVPSGKFWPASEGNVLSATVVSDDLVEIYPLTGAPPVIVSLAYDRERERYTGLPSLPPGTTLVGIALGIKQKQHDKVRAVARAVAALSSTYGPALTGARGRGDIALWYQGVPAAQKF
jgi:hypothetical protein